jgi:hypothetical protein
MMSIKKKRKKCPHTECEIKVPKRREKRITIEAVSAGLSLRNIYIYEKWQKLCQKKSGEHLYCPVVGILCTRYHRKDPKMYWVVVPRTSMTRDTERSARKSRTTACTQYENFAIDVYSNSITDTSLIRFVVTVLWGF